MTFSTTPSPEQLRTLPTADLALIILGELSDQANVNSMLRGREQTHQRNDENDTAFLLERFSDGWAWLVAHGLIGPHPTQDPHHWVRVTDRGRNVLATGNTKTVLAEQRLPDDLHPGLAQAQGLFVAGNSDLAVFAALREVEVELRGRSGAANDMIGVPLARYALDPEKGPLADQRLESGERHALSHLFAGALGAFKNPTSHRIVDYDDPAVAAGIILFADLLLRLLDQPNTTEEP